MVTKYIMYLQKYKVNASLTEMINTSRQFVTSLVLNYFFPGYDTSSTDHS